MKQKPDIQSSSERLADQRIMITLGLGAITFALTRDASRLASVFLIDYACALKRGAPVAIQSAIYGGAKVSCRVLVRGERCSADPAPSKNRSNCWAIMHRVSTARALFTSITKFTRDCPE